VSSSNCVILSVSSSNCVIFSVSSSNCVILSVNSSNCVILSVSSSNCVILSVSSSNCVILSMSSSNCVILSVSSSNCVILSVSSSNCVILSVSSSNCVILAVNPFLPPVNNTGNYSIFDDLLLVFDVIMKMGARPSVEDHDFSCILPVRYFSLSDNTTVAVGKPVYTQLFKLLNSKLNMQLKVFKVLLLIFENGSQTPNIFKFFGTNCPAKL